MKQTEILTHATHVNGWFLAVYMSCMSHNFRFIEFIRSKLSNFSAHVSRVNASHMACRRAGSAPTPDVIARYDVTLD